MHKKQLVVACLTAGASLVVSSFSHAFDTPPTMSVGGYARFQAFGVQNSKGTQDGLSSSQPNLKHMPGYGFAQAGEMNFTVAGALDDGTKYSYLITLDGGNGQLASKPAVTENVISFSNKWGSLQLGNVDGPTDFLTVGPMNVMGGTGGIGGDFTKAFVVPAGVFVGAIPAGDAGTATKVSYFSPRIMGVQAGISLAPNSTNAGTQMVETATDAPRSTANLGVALNYATAWNNVGLSVSAASLTGRGRAASNSQYQALNNLNSWQLGVLVTVDRWMFGAGYIDNNKSFIPKALSDKGADAGKAYTLAIGYNFGASKVGVGYQHSFTNIESGKPRARADVTAVTYDYTLAPGLGVYTEGVYARMRTTADAVALTTADAAALGAISNSGKASNVGGTIIAGVKISF